MKEYTYMFKYGSFEESCEYYFTSDTKYTEDDLKKIIHDAIIKYVTEDERVNTIDWESIFDTLYEISPIIPILEEEYDLTKYTPEYTSQVYFWGWSHLTSKSLDPEFPEHTPSWQNEINKEIKEIIKDRPYNEMNNGFRGR